MNTSPPSWRKVQEVRMQHEPSPGRQEPCISQYEGTRLCQSQGAKEHTRVFLTDTWIVADVVKPGPVIFLHGSLSLYWNLCLSLIWTFACCITVYEQIFTCNCSLFYQNISLSELLGQATYRSRCKIVDPCCPTFAHFPYSCSFPLHWPSRSTFLPAS